MDYLIEGSEYLAKFKNFNLVGRTDEMNMISSVLIRKKSNSILLVGPYGVGTSSLCLGLQEMKSKDDTPFDIASKRLFWLNTDELFSSGDSTQISKSFDLAIHRLKNSSDSILIIEDAGDFYDACINAGTTHFINTINSNVKDGKYQVIFEVSNNTLAKILSWHSDFKDSYTTIDITEPSGTTLNEIINVFAKKLEKFHLIKISQEAIDLAIDLTVKYRMDDGLGVTQPTRAIALLDRALSSYRLSSHRTNFNNDSVQLKNVYSRRIQYENAIISLEEQIVSMRETSKHKEVSNVGFDAILSGTTFDTPEISKIREKLEVVKDMFKKANEEYQTITSKLNENLILSKNEILMEFSRITGISVNKLGEDELNILRTLESKLKSHVFGQDHVLTQVSNAIKVSKIGRRNKSKPQASFLMMGPSGVGKTEVAKRIAETLQGDQKSLLRFDMSEYMERHAVSKLIGAPPGYEGFEAGGILTNAMRQNRNRIILFDEIEKAHPDVFNLFLQILDDGRLTDNVGLTADFSESIIIMTTNIGQPHFLNMEIDFQNATELAKIDLDEQYRPEFLNRFNGRQNIICFNRLEMDSIIKIVSRELNDLVSSYKPSGVTVEVSKETINGFCNDKYDARTGARGLPGYIISRLEPQVTEYILEGKTGKIEFIYNNGSFNMIEHNVEKAA